MKLFANSAELQRQKVQILQIHHAYRAANSGICSGFKILLNSVNSADFNTSWMTAAAAPGRVHVRPLPTLFFLPSGFAEALTSLLAACRAKLDRLPEAELL